MAKPSGGRPRKAAEWESKVRYNFVISYSKDRDVHTALHLAGVDVHNLITLAIREYVITHDLPAGKNEVQSRIAADALGLTIVQSDAIMSNSPLDVGSAQENNIIQPATVAIQPDPTKGISIPHDSNAIVDSSASESLLAFARKQLTESE